MPYKFPLSLKLNHCRAITEAVRGEELRGNTGYAREQPQSQRHTSTSSHFSTRKEEENRLKKLPLFNSLLIYSLQSVTTLKRRENQLRVLRSTTLTTKVLLGQLAHATIACKCIPEHTWLSLVCALEMRKVFVLEPRPLRS